MALDDDGWWLWAGKGRKWMMNDDEEEGERNKRRWKRGRKKREGRL